MLFNGERVGNGSLPEVDVALDPIDGTTPLAFGHTNSITTVSIAPQLSAIKFCIFARLSPERKSEGERLKNSVCYDDCIFA